MISAPELIAKIKSYHPNSNSSLVQKAYIIAKEAHGSQKRYSGESYFSHPLAVAEIITDLKLDDQSIITALLHDVVEDTEVKLNEIEEIFGDEIARLVDGVTKLGKIDASFKSENERLAENFRKLAMAMSQDIRVLLVKLADRLHNMRTLQFVPSREKRLKKAHESLEIYAPLAGRIGLHKIKDEIQELAFEIIDPKARLQIIEKLSEIKEKNKDLIAKILFQLEEIFNQENFPCKIEGREKKLYSIWSKMKRQNIGFHNLHDIMGIRIIVENIGECYRALGVVNSNFNMIPGTFKDYISTPKENGYQSLHLAILGPLNKKIEIQIRDKMMHEVSELGVAAHWNYKEKINKKTKNKIKAVGDEQNQYRWIRELINLFENSESPSEVLKNNKLSMQNDEVFCFSPNGDIFNLVLGATVLDFAFAVHSQIGNSCVSSKVNGAIAPLRQRLENGDQVEILTAKNSKPSPNWLQFVVTSKAKTAIRNFIRNEKYNEYSTLGKAIIQKYFNAKNVEFTEQILEKALPKFGKKNINDLCFRIADGTISRHDVFKTIYPDYEIEQKNLKISQKNLEKPKNTHHFLPIDGLVDGMAIKFAGCCSPIPGDQIVGIINTGTGVTIHNQFCSNLKNLALNPARVLDVCWKDNEKIGQAFICQIRVVVENKSGALADITNVIAKKKINIGHIKTTNRSADIFEVVINIEVKNVEHLEEVMTSLRMSKKTIEVQRVVGGYYE
ncbi:MAG: RelA/SpoT family protein [Rickettsiales bacterium]